MSVSHPMATGQTTAAPSAGRWLVATAFLASTTMMLALASFEFMLVPLQEDLGLTVDQANATNLIPTAAALLVIFAAATLSDRLGYRRLLVLGAVVYCSGALLVAVSTTFFLLLGGRALGGIGGSTMGIVGLAAVNSHFTDEHQRARAFAAFAALLPTVSFLAPPLAAAITDYATWRLVPVLWLVVGAATLAMSWRQLDRRAGIVARGSELGTPLLGGILLAACALGITLLTSNLPLAAALLVAAAGLLVVVVIVMRRAADPGLDLRLLRSRGAWWIVGATLATYGANLYFFTSLFMQYRYADPPVLLAVILCAPEVAALLGCFVSGWTADRWGAPRAALAALLVAAAACGGTLAVGPDSGTWVPVIALTTIAFPMAAAMGPLTLSLMNLGPDDGSSGAASIRDATQNLGGTIGGALVGTVAFLSFQWHMAGSLITAGTSPVVAAELAARMRGGESVSRLARETVLTPDACALLIGDAHGLRSALSVAYRSAGVTAGLLTCVAALLLMGYLLSQRRAAAPRPTA